MNKCKQCGKETKNLKFCSRSCSATYNNKGVRRHGKDHNCKDCGVKVSYKSKRCTSCEYKRRFERFMNRTLGDVRSEGNAKVAFSQVRFKAREILSNNGEEECEYCGFNHFADACHIKAVADFPDTALMSEINSLDNLIWLCPNHHRMLDKGLLNIEEIRNSKNTTNDDSRNRPTV